MIEALPDTIPIALAIVFLIVPMTIAGVMALLLMLENGVTFFGRRNRDGL